MNKAKNVTISVYSILLFSIALYTLATLIYSLIPNIPVNKLFAMIVAFTILYLYIQRITLERIIILLFCLFFSIYTTIISEYSSDNINDLLWIVTTVLIIGIASDQKFRSGLEQAIKRNKKWMKMIIIVIELILLMAVITPSSYGNDVGWGKDASYFVGFATHSHTLASACCLLIVLIMTVYKDKKISLMEYAYYILPIYSILFSGARTFLISVLILIMINVYMKKNSKLMRNMTLLVILSSFIFALFNSSMISKFEFTSNNVYAKNMLDSITNGRSEFWKYDLDLFFNSNFFIQLFGRGFEYIYNYNYLKVGIKIWAHNDIINNLISIGLIGTLGYVYIWFKYINNFFKRPRIDFSKVQFIIFMLFTLYIVAPMLLNGLYQYQHYIFSSVLLGQLISQRD
ncbi:O-antigen ligase family protein [Solibacillus sp. FSL K6-1523]|uniref:O-antigen ligase family protein n=1 Tax=Solibacillus sp. FSL K6-1523 TaxID=2921471 RepID=UPI0030F9E878